MTRPLLTLLFLLLCLLLLSALGARREAQVPREHPSRLVGCA